MSILSKHIVNIHRILSNCVFIFILIAMLAVRLQDLDYRPMHSDEAVNALKYGELLESGQFVYNPQEYHGPALYFFTLPISWLYGENSLELLTESELRLVPILFSLLLILSLLLLRSYLSWPVLLMAALLMAISPALFFYSRYYIHEMPFVFFCYAAVFLLWRYFDERKLWQAIGIGVFSGLAAATKETWVIVAVAVAVAAAVGRARGETRLRSLSGVETSEERNSASLVERSRNERKAKTEVRRQRTAKQFVHLLIGAASSLVVIVLFYTSFFQYPAGLANAFQSFTHYLSRAGGDSVHIYPWYYYLQLLAFFKTSAGGMWTEGIILLLAATAFLLHLLKSEQENERSLTLFMIIFTITVLIIFSLIPYKTPWNLLTFWPGIILLAAMGMVHTFKLLRTLIAKTAFFMVIMIGFIHLGWQSYQLNFRYACSPDNPYVYAHPTKDVFKIRDTLERIAHVHPPGYDVSIQVIAPENDYWPLPWYLRRFKHVGWWSAIDHAIPPAPLIIASPQMEDEMLTYLYDEQPPGERHLYILLFNEAIELRPGVELRGYIRRDLSELINKNE